jgi:HAE1 family hydrophobic/amphiphilic exporter-1
MGAAPTTLRLTVDDAVKMALDHNVDLAVDRLDPQIGDTAVAAANGAFKPTFSTSFQRNNQLQPPASFLIPTATRTDAITSNVGLSQALPWFGTSYSLSWNSVHTNSNSFLNSYNPILQSGLSLNLSQPLVRDLAIDNARLQLATSRVDRDIAGTRLRESLVHTTADVKSAYWNLVSAIATVDARRSSLTLAQELVRVNKAKVDIGQSPPLDLVSAEAEVASDQEQLIIAETAVRSIEDQLRALIFDTSDRSVWNVKIDPVDSPPLGLVSPDLEAAVTNALRDRADLARARMEIDTAQVSVKFTGNQRLPDVRLNASYVANGLGGTQVLRAGTFPGTIVGSGSVTDFGSVLNQLFTSQYPTWTVGVSVSYPLGQAVEEANYSRARLEHTQSQERLKSAASRAIQQVRDAGWKIEMNAKRIETTRAARDLAEQRLDSERKRFDVGMSTSFLVIQAQRDLAQARTNEVAAILAYDLALVDFEALQQAGPTQGQGSAATASGSGGTGGTSQPAPFAPTAASTTALQSAIVPGIPGGR